MKRYVLVVIVCVCYGIVVGKLTRSGILLNVVAAVLGGVAGILMSNSLN
jgi:TRAP-type uncharacterized transport system fused permease subunit